MSNERTLLELLIAVGRRVVKRLMPLLEPVGLSMHEMMVLWRVRSKSVCRLSEISDNTALAPSTLTGVIDRLESRGLLSRFADPNDRRATNIAVTTRGEELVAELLQKAEGELNHVFKNFGEERLDHLRSELVALLVEVENEEPTA